MQHLAIIMDGNRRWAKKNKLESFSGHKKGKDKIRLAIKFCIKNNIKHLSLYTFSLENFNRCESEKNYLFNLIVEGAKKELPELVEQGVQVKFVGDRRLFPSHIVSSINEIENKTKDLNKLHHNILFGYGAQQEVAFAVKSIAKKVKEGLIDIEEIDEKTVKNHLWTAGTPDPDLIVRTGGDVRLSNFLLYQAAYSEFAFLDCYWPEITEEHLQKCVDKFKASKRNFGI